MLDVRRLDKERPGQFAPAGKAVGFAEGDHVRLDRGPFDHKPVFRRILDHAFQPHGVAPFGCPEMRNGGRDGSLELVGARRVYGEIGDFGNHAQVMAAVPPGGKI